MRGWQVLLIVLGSIVGGILLIGALGALLILGFTSGCYDDCPAPPLWDGVNSIALSTNGGHALVASRSDGLSEVVLVDLSSGTNRVLVSTPMSVRSVAMYDEESWAYAAYDAGPFNGSTVVVVEGDHETAYHVPGLVTAMTYAGDGQIFLVEASWYGRSSPVGSSRPHGYDVWRLSTGSGEHVRFSWNNAYDMYGIAWDEAGHVVVSRGFKGPVNHDSDEYRTGLLAVAVDGRNSTWEILPTGDLLERTPLGFPVTLTSPHIGGGALRAIGWTGSSYHVFEIDDGNAVPLGAASEGTFPRALLPDGSGYLAARDDNVLVVRFGETPRVLL